MSLCSKLHRSLFSDPLETGICVSPLHEQSAVLFSHQHRDWKFMWPAFPRSWLYDWRSPSGTLQLPFQRRDATEVAMHQLCTSAVHMLHFLHFLNYACEKMENNSDHKQPPCFAHILSCPAWKSRTHSLRGFGCFSISSGHLGITEAMCTEVFVLAFYLQ